MKRITSFVLAAAALFACANSALSLTIKPNVGPIVTNPVPDQVQYVQTTRVIDMSPYFRDPDATAAVRVGTVLGPMNLTLDGQATPITVANFLNYLNSGRYFKADAPTGQQASLFFHRSVPGFVIQTGGFLGTTNSDKSGDVLASQVATFPAIQNEPLISNIRGTIAMAKLGGDPNSATSQWFINLADNSGNLDNQNGGFTVFGRVAGGGMTVADAIAALPRFNFNASFTDLPLRNYTTTDFNSGKKVKVPNLVSIPDLAQISPLSFSATSDNPGVATAAGSTGNLLVTAFQTGSATLTVTATDLDGATVSQSFHVNVVAAPARLRNIATRANFPSGSETLAGGFIVRGGTSKKLIVRAISTSLGVGSPLDDPAVELLDSGGHVVASNDNWVDSPDKQLLIDLQIQPGNDYESALIATVPSQDADITTYTARVRSVNGTPGVASVEVYDIDSGAGSTFRNISTLGPVGTVENALIGGFIVRGDSVRRVIVRGIGPSLTNAGIAGALPDPTITVVNNQGMTVASNDDWQNGSGASEIAQIGLQPSNPKEAAVILDVAAGEYTATVAGAGATPTGVGQVEVFVVQ